MPGLLPPVVAELSANLEAFTVGFEQATGVLDAFEERVIALGRAVDEVFTAAGERVGQFATTGGDALTTFTGVLDGLDASVRATAENIDTAFGEAATFADDHLAQIGTAADDMAMVVDAAAARVDEAAAAMDGAFATAATAARDAALSADASLGGASLAAGELGTATTAAAAESEGALGRIGAAFKTRMGEADSAIGGAVSGLKGYTGALLGTAVGVGYAASQAMKFQAAFTLLYTQAGLTDKQIAAVGMNAKSLQSELLALGNQTGFTGTQMAQALYHPISAGLDLNSALQVVLDSAKEARISGSDLTETTYTLSTVMKAFNAPASQAAQTMATLNAIIGNGDTTFQDLNESVKTWAPTAATFGVSLTSTGAALDYLTDRGDSATTAGTHLAAMMAMMVGQTKQASTFLSLLGVDQKGVTSSSAQLSAAMSKAGVTTTRLAADLRKPDGIYVALKDLHDSLVKSGMSANAANDVLVKVFGGGKSFKTVANLMNNLDQLKGKFDALSTQGSVTSWQADWEKASGTMSVKLHQLEATFQNLGIRIGTVALPYLTRFLGWITRGASWIGQHKVALDILIGVIGTLLVAALVSATTSMVMFTLSLVTDPIFLIVAAIAGLAVGIYELVKHWKSVWGEIKKIAGDVAHFVAHVWDDIAGAFTDAWSKITGALSKAWGAVVQAWNDTGGKLVHDIAHAFGDISKPIAAEWRKVTGDLSAIWSELIQLWDATGGRLNGYILDGWKALLGPAQDVWNGFALLFSITWDSISQIVSIAVGLVSSIIRAGWDLVRGIFKMAWDFNAGIIRAAWALITGIVRGAMTFLTGILKAGWTVIRGTFKITWDALTGELNAALDFIKNLLAVFVDLFTGKWSKLWGDVKHLFGQAWSDIRSLFGNVLRDIGQTVSSAVSSIWKGFIGGIEASLSGIGKALGDVVHAVVNVFKDAGHMLYQAGKDIVQGLINGVESMVGAVGHAIGGVAHGISSGFSSVLHILSPSRVFYGHGTMIGQGLVNALRDQIAPARAAARALAGAVADGFGAPSLGLPSLAAAGAGSYGAPTQGSTVVIKVDAGVVVYNETQFAQVVVQALQRYGMRAVNTNTSFQSVRGRKSA